MAQAAEDTLTGSTDALLLSRHSPAQLMVTSSSMAKDGLAGKSFPRLQHVLYPEISGKKPRILQHLFQLNLPSN